MIRNAIAAFALLAVGCSATGPADTAADVSLDPTASDTTPRGSSDGRMLDVVDPVIATPLSSGGGFRCEEKEHLEPQRAFVVKCQHEQEEMLLIAKLYSVAPEAVLPARKLVDEIYPRNYKKMFATFQITSVQTETIGPYEAVHVHLEATGHHGPVRLHERVIAFGNSVYILTALGSPAAFTKFEEERERWFAKTRFRDLR